MRDGDYIPNSLARLDMAQLLARPCSTRGCPNTTHEKYCANCKASGKARETRPNAAARGYDRRWQAYRIDFLNRRRLCEDESHKSTGELRAATRVDHIEPHHGDIQLFWCESNHQALCESCHNRKTAHFDGGFGRNLQPYKKNASF